MESLEEATSVIQRELTSVDSEVRAEYMSHFENDFQRFSVAMAHAVMKWREIDICMGDERRAYVSALVYSAISLHILSFKLLLSGHIVAAGNTFRQVIEAIALSLLCSNKDLPFLSAFMEGKYSTKNAVRDVAKNWKKLGLMEGASNQLQAAQIFYGQYSHITALTLANSISFSKSGAYVGACFDAEKIQAYRQEVTGRVSLSDVFTNFIAVVQANLIRWQVQNARQSRAF
ncbi:MAG: hypothetical protein ACT4PG_03645 [Panacagrimonas sp.]